MTSVEVIQMSSLQSDIPSLSSSRSQISEIPSPSLSVSPETVASQRSGQLASCVLASWLLPTP